MYNFPNSNGIGTHMTTSPDIKTLVSTMDSAEKVYDLFRGLGYPADKLLDPSYKRKISEFGLAIDEREKVRNIYTVFNYDGKLQIFLLEVKSLSAPLIRYLTKRFSDIYERFLLVLTNDYREYAFIFPRFERVEVGKTRLKLTRLVFERENPYHTDLLTISGLKLTGEEENHRDIWRKWQEAFSVEKVTDSFFEDYKKVFFKLRETFEKQEIPVKEAHELSQQFLNRLMFLYFIAKKKWINDDPKFIRWYWQRYKKEKRNGQAEDDTFYENWLKILFLEAFNNKYSHPVHHPGDVKEILALAPYLNGGLFRRGDLDELDFTISDSLFEGVFNFFEQYNFTIREELPLDVEVAVDPQMIGYVYESLSNVAENIYERQDLGIFYTPTAEVDFMCRRTLVEYLANNIRELPKEQAYRLLFDEDRKKASEYLTEQDLWHTFEEALDNLAVVDPACGSGAFLIGMLHVLVDLYRLTYGHIEREMSEFELKKQIIGTSLYGVDVMPWAVRSAELRLWLQLIIEEDIPKEERRLHPLLPNLTLRLRVGDSLVQEVGGVNLHMRDSSLSPAIKRKLTVLKREKEKFYNNDPTAKFKHPEPLLREELRVFRGIFDERILNFKKEILILKGKRREEQLDLIGVGRDKTSDQKLFEWSIDNLEKDIESLVETQRRLQDPGKKPFIWDIDFAEIFGDKGGFDIVIGNPPYVRQEKIAPPNRLKAEVTLEDKREYKTKLLRSIQAHFPFIKKLDKKSDYYIYFYFHGLSLLNEKGAFCFITSNSWLDVGYGKDLQEFLLKYCPIKAIYDNEAKRSFAHADVNTVIALLGAPETKKAPGRWPALVDTARFVMFKRPFEEVVNTANLLEMERAEKIQKTSLYRIYPIKQEALLEEGWEKVEKADTGSAKKGKKAVSLLKGKFESGKYESNKWGGKYLRAPDIFFTILDKGSNLIERMSSYFVGERYLNTGGADGFFILTNVSKEENGLCRVFNDKTTDKNPKLIFDGLIESKYLIPLIKNYTKTNKKIEIDGFDAYCLVVNESPSVTKRQKVNEYITWGEKQGYNQRSVTKNQNPWYKPTRQMLKASEILVPRSVNETYVVHCNPHNYLSLRFYRFYLKKGSLTSLLGMLNSTYIALVMETLGNRSLGQGVLDFFMADFLRLKIPVTQNSSMEVALKHLSHRKIGSIYKELGISPSCPIREQTPNPLPDRKALDDIVFDILGLTEEERREVYWAVCELVKNRLDKARSV